MSNDCLPEDIAMPEHTEIRVPDIGDFDAVDVIEVHVAAGDTIDVEDPLITLETDKASMDVPATVAGTVTAVAVSVGDKVSEGTVIVRVEAAEGAAPGVASTQTGSPAAEPAGTRAAPDPAASKPADVTAGSLVVIGAGPGGYTAAFRAADLGMDVTLVERYPSLGGVCLNVGCIPSKALLHAARVIEEASEMGAHGIEFGPPRIDTDRLRGWKEGIVSRLTGGLSGLAKKRKVRVLTGTARFTSPHELQVTGADGVQRVAFEHCIIAAGSQPVSLPGVPDDPRVIDSTGALELEDLPERMLVIGGGIIGLEMATVYDALGVKVTVVELTEQLMPGCDPDLVRPLQKRVAARYESILTGVRVTAVEASGSGLTVSFDGADAPAPQTYDRVLVAVGRRPNGGALDAANAGVNVDERGYIAVDRQMRTNVPHIFAIGDVVGQPMLAHKATHEGKVAAEAAAGHQVAFDARTIPSVAYTDPEVAWVGLTEEDARRDGVSYEKAAFPWAASGRSLAIGRDEGFTKLLFDPDSGRVLGGGIVGTSAGDLIAEVGLAIEMGCDAADVGLTIHPHPTLSETVAMAAEAFEGTLTDLYMPRKR
jgi:dihydrolipoamide dehydrogenase